MLRNLEIKAHVRNLDQITTIAKTLSDSDGEFVHQHDIFYNVSNGRLKLRKFENKSTLVYYDRPNTTGPKISEYEKCDFPAPTVDDVNFGEKLGSILNKSIGVKGELRKVRHLFIVGQTRIHIDQVEGLGNFMELEVVLSQDQTLEEGENIANDLQKKLGIPEEDLLSGAYMDMLLEKTSKN